MLRLLILAFFFLMASPAAWADPAVFQTVNPPSSPSQITALAPAPDHPQGLLAASESAIYALTEKSTWVSVWRQGKLSVHDFRSFPELPDRVFALTDKGVLMGDFQKRVWRKVFSFSGSAPGVLAWAVVPGDPDHWIAGTSEGLYESDDAGRSWGIFETFRAKDPVLALFFRYQQLWVVTPSHVYASSDLRSFRPVFSLTGASGYAEKTESETPFEEETENSRPVILTAEASEEVWPRIWIATTRGVFELDPENGAWERLPGSGLSSPAVTHLAFSASQKKLLAGTKSGLYFFNTPSSRWENFSPGLSLREIRAMSLVPGTNEVLASVSARGIFLFPLRPSIEIALRPTDSPGLESFQNLEALTRAEPGIRDIQNAVVRAFNCGQKKMNRWHKESRLRALFPSVSFGRDFSWDNNIDIDRGGTNDPDTYIEGPDQLSKGWDFDVSWDLGDLIWGNAQTSIDSRDKITAEFRNDLLAEATRLYYERRRLQITLAETKAPGDQTSAENLLRLEELTALLDAMTEGYLSKEIARRRESPLF